MGIWRQVYELLYEYIKQQQQQEFYYYCYYLPYLTNWLYSPLWALPSYTNSLQAHV
jgi:hypothetical protein